MGAVELTSRACVAVMTGQPIAQEGDLLPFLSGNQGTKNQRYMAGAAGLGAASPEVRAAAQVELDALLAAEEAGGPSVWEVLCPDPHGGMYALAWVGVVAAGMAPAATATTRELGRRAAVILGQALRLGDLVATPDGDLTGLPGMRAPTGAALARRSLSAVWIEVRRRQPGWAGLVHRGTGGRPRALRWAADSDPLIDGAACWLSAIFDAALGGQGLLAGPLADDAPLPAHLRLPLTVYRWAGGTLASFEDPGDDEARSRYIVTGSAASKRDPNHEETPVTWVRVEWGTPANHRVEAGIAWRSTPPAPPPGASRTFIPGAQSAPTPTRPTRPQPPAPPGPGEERPMEGKSLGQALFESGFVTASWYPFDGGSGDQLPAPFHHDFHPEASAYRNRFGPLPRDVKGWPSGVPHGGRFTTAVVVDGVAQDPELRALVGNAAFRAANPQFAGVALSFDRDYLDLCFLDGAWRWLLGQAARFDPQDVTATGPHRDPEGGVAVGDPAPGGGVVTPPKGVLTPAPLPPAPSPIAPTAPAPALPPPQPTPQQADPRAAGYKKILEGLEELFPGQALKYGGLAQLLLAGGKPSVLTLLLAVAPLFE